MVNAYLVTIGILSFAMSFSIGANDAANALATSYGSNALKLLYLVALGGVFEFIGAMFCSSHVASNLVGDVIKTVDDIPDNKLNQAMLAASIASFLFIMSSSIFGMPISGTHTVVGALIGCGIASVGWGEINWAKLGQIVAGWFVAPAVAIVLAAIFFLAVCGGTLNEKRSLPVRLFWQ